MMDTIKITMKQGCQPPTGFEGKICSIDIRPDECIGVNGARVTIVIDVPDGIGTIGREIIGD